MRPWATSSLTKEDFADSHTLLYGLVTQSWPALCNPMDYSPSRSSVQGDSPGKNPGVDCHFLLQPYSILVLFVPRLLRLRHVPALNSPSFISRQHSSKPPNPM